jgi:hypothetical protein
MPARQREFDMSTKFIALAGKIDQFMRNTD